MKSKICLVLLCAGAVNLSAQNSDETQQLRQQLEDANKQFEKLMQEQRQVIEDLNQRLHRLERESTNAPPSAFSPPAGTAAESVEQPWSPTAPMRLVGNARNYINISLDALFAAGYSTAEDIEALQLGGHDPRQRGFTLQNLEATFSGRVDPYFRGQANVIFLIDPDGETVVEIEEAFMETMALPWNMQVKAGHYFTEFGRQNPKHPHTWDFVDVPLVNGRFFGEDGLRNPGARLSWLAPTPFYSEFMIGVQNSHGETALSFRNAHDDEPYLGRLHEVDRLHGFGDLLFAPRYAASFDLTDEQTVLMGASGAFAPNASGSSSDTQIYGLDFFWKWKPVDHHAGFPFVTFQTEGMIRRYQAGAFDWDLNEDGLLDSDELDLDGDGVADVLPRERLLDYGAYAQMTWGFRKGWVAGMRGDWLSSRRADYEDQFGRDADRATRWRLSPNLTYYPTEYSKLRLQYNHDNRTGFGTDHSVWLQAEFLLGAHAAHKF